jgi:SAM-dependent methyltransferase
LDDGRSSSTPRHGWIEGMDRAEWLVEKRRLCEERMDTIFAPIYDDDWGAYINETHASFVRKVLDVTSDGAAILDAACGTGKYWTLLALARRVVGADQSTEMLAQASAKVPDVEVLKVGPQDLAFDAVFDAVVCIDAMENVAPEDWPLVLANLRRALRGNGILYATVELPDDEEEIAQAFQEGRERGLPIIEGEVALEGYHYYPPIPRARAWLADAGFEVLEEGVGDGYHHFLSTAASEVSRDAERSEVGR